MAIPEVSIVKLFCQNAAGCECKVYKQIEDAEVAESLKPKIKKML